VTKRIKPFLKNPVRCRYKGRRRNGGKGSFEVGKLGSFEVRKLGSYEVMKLGSWEKIGKKERKEVLKIGSWKDGEVRGSGDGILGSWNLVFGSCFLELVSCNLLPGSVGVYPV
jgi:hypothetical protein